MKPYVNWRVQAAEKQGQAPYWAWLEAQSRRERAAKRQQDERNQIALNRLAETARLRWHGDDASFAMLAWPHLERDFWRRRGR